MKKTLIAVAALAATGAFAQVVITGVIDAGYKVTAAPATSTNSGGTSAIAGNLTATSAVKFVGNEDLGGGMSAGFLSEINPNVVQSSTSNQGNAFVSEYSGTPFNGEQFLRLSSASMGEVKLGVPNAAFFGVAMSASPLGTAMGSGYSASGIARLGTTAPGIVSGIGSGTTRIIRHERTVQYSSPVFNGITAQVTYAPQNDNNSAATSNGNQDGYTDIAVKYSNGPLNLGFANAVNKFGAGTTPALGLAYAAATTATGQVSGDFTYNILAGNYTFGSATVYAGYTTTKSNGTVTAEDANSWNIAGKYTMGKVDYMANYLVRNSNLTNANNAKLFGLAADYNLSKRTALTARYEMFDTNTNSQTTAPAGGSVTNAFGFGVRHAF